MFPSATLEEYPKIDLSGGCALIIDDDASIRTALRRFLAEDGLFTRFYEAQNGLEGFKVLANQAAAIDVVICDIEMPDFDGFKFLQMHATREDFAAVPVIIVTSRADQDNRVRGLELGAADYLSKPVFKQELRLRAKHQLHIRRLEDRLRTAIRDLSRISKTDPLTGLPNRRLFMDSLEREFRRAARYRHAVGVLIMDIDDFKSVNDTYGHLAGDEVLRAVAGVLERGLRQSDLAARFGGEEFAVLLPETDATAAAAVGDRYRREIGALRIAHEGVQIGITISVGVGAYPETANTSIDDLLRAADAALYAAKEAGKNRVEVASGK